jgi:hypothetical protein
MNAAMAHTREVYRQFCEQHSQVPLFSQTWFLDAVCTDGIWGAALAIDNGRVAAALPYFVKQRWGLRYITMPHFCKYLGPFFADDVDLTTQHRLLAELLSQLPRVQAFHQNFHPDITNWLPFYWNDYQQTTYYTYIIRLQQPELVFHNINRNMRRNIQKAQALLTIDEEDAPDLFYEINRLSFQRQGLRPPYTREQFLRQDAALAAHNARRITFARDAAGKLHSAAYLVWDRQRSYYHLSGDDPAQRSSGGGILLVYDAIRYTSEKLGLSIFDFEGSMLPGVEAIRRQFGAVQTPYSHVWRYHSRLLRLWAALRR